MGRYGRARGEVRRDRHGLGRAVNLFDEKGGRASLRGLRPGFPSQLSYKPGAGCDSLGQPRPVSETHFIH